MVPPGLSWSEPTRYLGFKLPRQVPPSRCFSLLILFPSTLEESPRGFASGHDNYVMMISPWGGVHPGQQLGRPRYRVSSGRLGFPRRLVLMRRSRQWNFQSRGVFLLLNQNIRVRVGSFSVGTCPPCHQREAFISTCRPPKLQVVKITLKGPQSAVLLRDGSLVLA